MTKRLDTTLSGRKDSMTPIWLMRQAGRYLPEYRELRSSEPDFISYCLNPEKACEATLQPLRRYDLDAAIIFSDILMIPWAMQAGVHFVQGEGPKLNPLAKPGDVTGLNSDDLLTKLNPVFDALRKTRAGLREDRNLIGFCGAPWTVATYMIEGGSSRDFQRSREMLWQDSDGMMMLIDRLVEESIVYLAAKAQAGADTLMVFDSWASAVPSTFLEAIVIEPMQRIIAGLRGQGITTPVIGFPKGIGEGILAYADKTNVDAIGLDHGVDPFWADANLPKDLVVQGNLDPVALIEGGSAMLAATDKILEAFASRPHIFNLGHGIGQFTPPAHVTTLIDHIRKVEG
ncbi:MAG: uroporphyrinogen decarboxylase [Candidatus Puniceispirillales bacterium]